MKCVKNCLLTVAFTLAATHSAAQNAEALTLDALLGTWNMTYDMGQGPQTGTITISRSDDGGPRIAMSTTGGGSSEARAISIAGDTITYVRDVSAQGQSITVNYSARLIDGKLEGSFELDLGALAGAAAGLGGPTAWTATMAR